MGKRDRKRKPARPKSQKPPKPVILVVCEGGTEVEYIRGFKNWCRNPRVTVEEIPNAGVPKSVVDEAKRRKKENQLQAKRERDENLKYDEVWCVFDVDEHPNFSEAKQNAKDAGLRLAVSNPCFELWLVLHFREPPGLIHRHDVQSMLANYIQNYNKHVDFDDYQIGYLDAVKRASRLPEPDNPSTGVARLTESIRDDP